jgi:hypothetical protein
LKNIFLVRKKYWKITKIGWCYRGMAVVLYIMLNKEFLARIKWVTHKSHIVRRVSRGTHIRPSPANLLQALHNQSKVQRGNSNTHHQILKNKRITKLGILKYNFYKSFGMRDLYLSVQAILLVVQNVSKPGKTITILLY